MGAGGVCDQTVNKEFLLLAEGAEGERRAGSAAQTANDPTGPGSDANKAAAAAGAGSVRKHFKYIKYIWMCAFFFFVPKLLIGADTDGAGKIMVLGVE